MRAALILPAAAAVLLLAGCTLAIEGDGRSAGQPAAEAPRDGAATDAATGQELGADNPGVRADWEPLVEERDDCASGSVSVVGSYRVVQITADCPLVTVTGSSAVLGERIERLELVGSESIVFARSLGDVEITGGGTVLRWDEGEPNIDSLGSGTDAAPASER